MSLWDWIRDGREAREREVRETPELGARRRALQALARGSAAALVSLGVPSVANASEHEEASEAPAEGAEAGKGPKHKWGMAIDLDRCTGCGGCVVACQVENNVAPLGPETSAQVRGNFWMDLLQESKGKYPEVAVDVMPLPCMHCDDAPCVKVCPVGATYQSEDGIVAQIWDRCIGCRYCMAACPYSRRHFNWTAPKWTESEMQSLNPDVGTRPVGVVEKCTFCTHRIRNAKEQARYDEKPLVDADLQHLTACATACPARAITFGDLNDPHSEVSRLHASPRSTRLLEQLGTKPKVVYLRQTKWQE